MKAAFFLSMAFVVLAGSVSAQSMAQTKSLTKEEVPVVVQQAFQKDFSSLSEGTWKLRYSQDANTKQFTPELYTYTCKNNGERVEVFFKPDGKLDHTKGIAAPTQGAAQK